MFARCAAVAAGLESGHATAASPESAPLQRKGGTVIRNRPARTSSSTPWLDIALVAAAVVLAALVWSPLVNPVTLGR